LDGTEKVSLETSAAIAGVIIDEDAIAILASSTKTAQFLREELLHSGSRHVHRRIPGPALMRARDALLRRWHSLVWFWCVLRLEGRSIFYRKKILLSRNHHVDLGLVFQTAQNGHRLLNKRIHAHNLGTQELENDCPASNEIDTEVFRRGSDAGGRFSLLGVGISEQELEKLMPSFVCPSAGRSGS
jgi:hypothetical protein